MTLDEAIKHCLEVAEQNDTQAEKWNGCPLCLARMDGERNG